MTKPTRRRDPYERALTAATKRRDRAIIDRDKCEQRYHALMEEIPRLEQIIAVLGQKTVHSGLYVTEYSASEMDADKITTKEPLPIPGLPGGIPTHLEKYLRQVVRPQTTVPVPTTNPDAEDDALPAVEGEPILE